jgi:hypothetical protein
VIWTDAVATTAGQAPIRGFGGRLMFYEGNNDAPVKVEGTLVVYAFDETNRDPNNAKPDCKYVITQEQLSKHYSKSKVGHSYSMWVPWDRAGGMQKEITLIVRFEPKIGPPVIGDQCHQMLPGKLPPGKADPGMRTPPQGIGMGVGGNYGPGYQAQREENGNGVRQASFELPQDAAATVQDWRNRRMTTTTISVPEGLALRRSLNAPQAPQQQPAPNAVNSWPGASQAPRYGQPPAGPAFQPNPPEQSQQPQAGYQPGRPWAPAEPLAQLNRDRAPWPQRAAAPQYGPATQPAAPFSNAAPARPSNVPPPQYQPGPYPQQ